MRHECPGLLLQLLLLEFLLHQLLLLKLDELLLYLLLVEELLVPGLLLVPQGLQATEKVVQNLEIFLFLYPDHQVPLKIMICVPQVHIVAAERPLLLLVEVDVLPNLVLHRNFVLQPRVE